MVSSFTQFLLASNERMMVGFEANKIHGGSLELCKWSCVLDLLLVSLQHSCLP